MSANVSFFKRLLRNMSLSLSLVMIPSGVALAEGGRDIAEPTVSKAIISTSNTPRELERRYAAGPPRHMKIYLTGYSFWDNTPRGTARIAHPVIHKHAGGIGTYDDPVTVAVGHKKVGSRSRPDFPVGTRIYFPKLKKYGIVEDLCGDGPKPQNGPCHSGYRGLVWLDIYVGGRSLSEAATDLCMRSITGVQSAMMNPARGLPVQKGEISLSNCRQG
ncbi:hypothetical protein [Marimonas lutisalis]|uniref:hypothetical protein n=1 Tax=Marimonas lutisalis TaxID=2545756 RepID=UPI001F1D8703|nr:hypothetical protein [Marimonas lutisalis]